jgi:hypothetical protein
MLHERDRDALSRHYRIWPIAENWRRSGIKVRLVYGPHSCTDCDVLFPHIDCSYITDEYWDVISSHRHAINAGVRDIRKTVVSRFLVERNDPYDGPVIVKTNNNSGGFMDLEFGQAGGPSRIDSLRKRLAWHPLIQPRSLGWTQTLTKYFRFDHISHVPKGAWNNPHLVVERFFEPDRNENNEHVLYLWIVLGNQGIGRTLLSADPFIKNSTGTLGWFERPPPEILEAKQSFGVDYGKIDYVMCNGEPVLLDINKTPSVSGNAHSNKYTEQCKHLAYGISSIFRD